MEKKEDLTSLVLEAIDKDINFQKQFNDRLQVIKQRIIRNSDDKNLLELQKTLMESLDEIKKQEAAVDTKQYLLGEKQVESLGDTHNNNNVNTRQNELEHEKIAQYKSKLRKNSQVAESGQELKVSKKRKIDSEFFGNLENTRGTKKQAAQPRSYGTNQNRSYAPPVSAPANLPTNSWNAQSQSSSTYPNRIIISTPVPIYSTGTNQPVVQSTQSSSAYPNRLYPRTPVPISSTSQPPVKQLPSTNTANTIKQNTTVAQTTYTQITSLPLKVEVDMKEAIDEAYRHDHEIQIFLQTASSQLKLFYDCLLQYLTTLSTGLYGAKGELLKRNTTLIEKMNNVGKAIFTVGVSSIPAIGALAGTTGIALPIVGVLMPVIINLASFAWDKAIGNHIEIEIKQGINTRLALFGRGYSGADIFSETVALRAAICLQKFLIYLSNDDIIKFAEQWGKHFIESIFEKEEAQSHRLSTKITNLMSEIKNSLKHKDEFIYINNIPYSFETLCQTFFSNAVICFYDPISQSVSSYGRVERYYPINLYFNSKEDAINYILKMNRNDLETKGIFSTLEKDYFYNIEFAEKRLPHSPTKRDIIVHFKDKLDALTNDYIKLKKDKEEENERFKQEILSLKKAILEMRESEKQSHESDNDSTMSDISSTSKAGDVSQLQNLPSCSK